MRAGSPSSPLRWALRLAPVAIPLGISLGGTFWTYHLALERAVTSDQTRLERHANQLRTELREFLDSHQQILHAARGLFAAKGEIEREEWSCFAREILRGPNQDRIDALAFVQPIEGRLIVRYVSPEEPNVSLVGLDLGHDPELRRSLERCRDTGEVTTVEQIQFPGLQKGHVHPALVQPVYRSGPPSGHAQLRTHGHVGWVVAPVQMTKVGQLFRGVVPPGLNVRLYPTDHPELPCSVLEWEEAAGDDRPKGGPLPSLRMPIRMGDQELTLEVLPSAGFFANDGRMAATTILLRGLVATSLLAVLVWGLFLSRRRVISAAEKVACELRETEARIRGMIESSIDASATIDEQGNLAGWNARAEEMFGWTKAEILDRDFATVLLPETEHKPFAQAFTRAVADPTSRRASTIELTALARGGRLLPVAISFLPAVVGGKALMNLTIRDLSDRARTEEQLWRLSLAASRASSAVLLLDRQGIVTWVNDSFTKLTGFDPHEVEGGPLRSLGDPSNADQRAVNLLREKLAGMAPVRAEALCHRKDGRAIWIEIDGAPVPDEAPEHKHYVVVATDITERRRAEDALRSSEERFRALIENASDVVIVIDAKGKISYASPAVESMLGYAPRDLLDHNLSLCVAEADQGSLREVLLRRVLPAPGFLTSQSLRFVHRDGSIRCVEVVFRNLLEDPTLQGIIVTARDVTESTLQQEALRRRDAILATVGFAAETFLKSTSWRDAIDAVLANLGEASQVSRVYIFENHAEPGAPLLTSRRFEWAVEGVSAKIDDPDLQNMPYEAAGLGRWIEVLRRGDSIVGPVRNFERLEQALLTANGVRSILIMPIFADGAWWGFIGFDDCLVERTWTGAEVDALRTAAGLLGAAIEKERAQIELQHLVAKLEEARLKAEGQAVLLQERAGQLLEVRDRALESTRVKSEFLAKMSHEIRTPMNGIIGMTSLLLDSPLDAEARHYALTIRNSAEALLDILNDILDFSRMEAGKVRLAAVEFNPRLLVHEIVELFTQLAREKGLDLIAAVPEAFPDSLVGDPGRIRQVLVNLVGNALKFTDHGSVTIQAGLVQESADQARIRLQVIDTGIGIPRDRQEMIFESFTQADGGVSRRYGGTGLGLTISRQLTELMGGKIGLSSEPGAGSTFWVELVLAKRRTDDRGASHTAGAVEGDRLSAPDTRIPDQVLGLRVLVAEDDAVSRKVVLRLLQKWGCEAEVARNGIEALHAVQTTPFDVVLMDCEMPEMDGFTAAGRIRQLDDSSRRRIPIVAMTAHALEGDRERCRAAGMDGYVPKPLQPRELHEALVRLGRTARPARAVEWIPAAPERQRPEVLSIDRLLESCGDDPDFLRGIVGEFLDATPGRLAELRSAIAAGDAKRTEILAHGLKGSSRTLGGEAFAASCEELEVLASSGGLAGAFEMLGPVEAEYARLVLAMKERFHRAA